MKMIKSDLLDLLDEKELAIACKNADLEFFLAPMKNNPKLYAKYTKSLGRLDKKSPLVKKLMPKYACELYSKGDEKYCSAFGFALSGLKRTFEDACKKCSDVEVSHIREYDTDSLVKLYSQVSEVLTMEVSCELYIVFLKLQGVCFEEDKLVELETQIENVIEHNKTQKAHEKEIEDALKKQEKLLNSQFDQEKERYHKEKKKLSKENGDLKKLIQELNRQVECCKQREENEHQRIIEEWNKSAEKECEKIRKEQEQKLSQIYKEELAGVRRKVEEEKEKQEKILNSELEKIRADNKAEQEKLTGNISELENEKNRLLQMKDSLNHELVMLKENLERQRKIEDEFFENIDKRVYEKKLDEALVKKLKYNSECQNDSKSEMPETTMPTVTVADDIQIYESSLKKDEIEECESVYSLSDFEADLRDNISLYFEEAMDISFTAVSALVLRKTIIVEQSVAYTLAKCISSITSASMPCCIRIHDAVSANLTEVIDVINKQTNKTILIDGVLDKYDESLFAAICSECEDRHLIFAVSDINNLKLCSKVISNFAIVLDIEEYFTYESSDPLLIADNDIYSLLGEISQEQCRSYYDKVFRGLVSKKIIGKKNSIDFSKMLYVYYSLVEKEIIYDVMKKSILHCCDIEDEQDIEKILVRAGLK